MARRRITRYTQVRVRFRFFPLRFEFSALDSVHFPPGLPGNALRGALGTNFRRIVCEPSCPGARDCPGAATCAYARIFEPRQSSGPSGLADPPRPFVFRASHLAGLTIAPGRPFHFDLNLFETRDAPIGNFVGAFSAFAEDGIGAARGRARLLDCHLLGLDGAPTATWSEGVPLEPAAIDLAPHAAEIHRLLLRFLTATELKDSQRFVERPEFDVLIARIRDRLGTLSALYGDGPLPLGFAAMRTRAAEVRLTECRIERVSLTRHSTRTGQSHPLGGFTGEAVYEGPIAPFLPYLEAARFTGVGRQTVWGKGEIALTVLP